jgi:hypothetical protein
MDTLVTIAIRIHRPEKSGTFDKGLIQDPFVAAYR